MITDADWGGPNPEKQILGALLVSEGFAVAAEINPADFAGPLDQELFSMLMEGRWESPAATLEGLRGRGFVGEDAEQVPAFYLLYLVESLTTCDTDSLKQAAAQIQSDASERRQRLETVQNQDVMMDICSQLWDNAWVPYRKIFASINSDAITRRVIDAGLRILLKRGAVEMKSEGGASLWRLVEMAAEENEIEAERMAAAA